MLFRAGSLALLCLGTVAPPGRNPIAPGNCRSPGHPLSRAELFALTDSAPFLPGRALCIYLVGPPALLGRVSRSPPGYGAAAGPQENCFEVFSRAAACRLPVPRPSSSWRMGPATAHCFHRSPWLLSQARNNAAGGPPSLICTRHKHTNIPYIILGARVVRAEPRDCVSRGKTPAPCGGGGGGGGVGVRRGALHRRQGPSRCSALAHRQHPSAQALAGPIRQNGCVQHPGQKHLRSVRAQNSAAVA